MVVSGVGWSQTGQTGQVATLLCPKNERASQLQTFAKTTSSRERYRRHARASPADVLHNFSMDGITIERSHSHILEVTPDCINIRDVQIARSLLVLIEIVAICLLYQFRCKFI